MRIQNIVFCVVLLCVAASVQSKHAISYDLGGGRFGDKVLGYLQARCLAYVTGVTFLYRPFDFGDMYNYVNFNDQLIMDYDALPYVQYTSKYHTKYTINSPESLTHFFKIIRDVNTHPTLFILEYFPADISEWDNNPSNKMLFNFPWHDNDLRSYLRKSLRPRREIPSFRVRERLNVAVHVRTLSGKDTVETSFLKLPLKHPTVAYHKRQIEKVYHWNLGRPMHVFLFSDTKDPLKLKEDFCAYFNGKDIVFNIQNLTEPDLTYTIQDFFAMQQFDVLIATQSNYSMMAARLGDFDMVIFPIHVCGVYPNSYIDRVQVVSKRSFWFPYDLNIVLKE